MNKKCMYKVLKKKSIFIILFIISTLSFPIAFAGTTFSSIQNLSNDAANSREPAIFSLGDKSYITWYDSNNDIRFTNTTNTGTIFFPDIDIGDTNTGGTAASKPDPQITSDGTNVFIAWHDNGDIRFSRSTDNGQTFPSVSDIGDSTSTKDAQVHLTNSTNGDVYVAWIDGSNDIRFSASANSGVSFDTANNIDIGNSPGGVIPSALDMISKGSNVYVVWVDAMDIRFSASANNGASFSTSSEISIGTHDGFGTVVEPSIAAFGNNVYVVWADAGKIFFKKSTDSGASFSFPTTPSNGELGTIDQFAGFPGPKVAVDDDGNVYVVWNDSDEEIQLRRSVDSGVTFAAAENISNTGSPESVAPRIATSGDSVAIVWQEDDAGGETNDNDIKIATSTDNGVSFPSVNDITENSLFDSSAEIGFVGTTAYTVWQEKTGSGGTDGEIQLSVATIVGTEVTFDKTQYKLSDTATITVTDSSSDTSIQVTITSTTSGSGITITLPETSPGVFTNTFTFSEELDSSSADKILKAKPADIISTTFNSVPGSASIFQRTISFDKSPSYTLDDIAHLEVNDQNSNTNTGSKDSIIVTITTQNTADSVTLTLEETDINNGIFGNTANNNLIFMNGDFRIPLDRTITVTETVNDVKIPNPDPTIRDTKTATYFSDTDNTVRNLILTETNINTNIYTGQLTISGSSSATNQILASLCDIVRVTSSSGLTTNLFVTACDDAKKAAIQVNVGTGSDDVVTATYKTATDSEIVKFDGGESGGGGGGLVRPTVVLNAILATVLGGSGSDRSPPISTLDNVLKARDIDVPDHIKEIVENHNPKIPIEGLEDEPYDLPLSINEKKYPLGSNENTIKTNHVDTDKLVKFQMMFYEQRDLEHVSMYMNLRDGNKDDKSDTYIIFDKRKPMEIVDKNGFFKSVNFEIVEGEDNKKFATFEIIFAKPMETSDLIYKAWDFDRRGTAVLVQNAIKVEEVSKENGIIEDIENENTDDKLESNSEEKKPVPEWVKSNARWWSEGQIDDETFTNGIGFLISEKIIDVPTESNISKSKDDSDMLKEEIVEEENSVKVPQWVKNNVKWWSDELLDEETFLSGIEYLVKHEIITVQ